MRYFLLGLFILSACYSSSPYDPTQRSDYYRESREVSQGSNRLPDNRTSAPVAKAARKLPWEVWATGRDLAGQAIANTDLLKGDTYAQEGLRAQALVQYKRIDLNKLSEQERAAVVYRIAAMELAADKPQAALGVLGWFTDRSKLAVAEVNPFFALLMGYAYGRNANYDQAFAWFSKVNSQAAGQGGLSQSATSGMQLLARSIADDQYQHLSDTWSSDAFVKSILGQEYRRRAQSGVKVAAMSAPFWMLADQESMRIQSDLAGAPGRIVVMLPLTGQYASLGQATKRGVELAFRGNGLDTTGVVEYRDTAGDIVQAAALVEELALSKQPAIILGPLLADESRIVADLARRKSIPALTLTKNSDFVTGDNIFRLGPTAATQVDSLLEAAYFNKNVREFGFVYTNEPQSQELVESARRKLAEWNLTPVYEVSYTRGNLGSMGQIAQQIEAQPVEAIFFTDDIQAATRLRFQMPDMIRNKTLFLGTARWDVADELRQSAKALEGCMFVSPYFVFSDNPYVKQFQQTYKATYNHEADFLAAQGFDAATLVMAAFENSEGLKRDFSAALRGVELYRGLTGEIAIATNGELQRRFMVVEVGPQGEIQSAQTERKVYTGYGQYELR